MTSLIGTTPARALVVGAHPDDAELFAGGTVAAWCAAGAHVEFCVLTDGRLGSQDPSADPDVVAAVRASECEAAAAVLGVAAVRAGGFPDGGLRAHRDAATMFVARAIREVRPDIVIGHDPWRLYEMHPDHRAAGWATCDGLIAAREHHGLAAPALPAPLAPAAHRADLWLMGTSNPDLFIPVEMETKLRALSAHASQFAHVGDWRARVETWNRAIGGERGHPAAEAFHRALPPVPSLASGIIEG